MENFNVKLIPGPMRFLEYLNKIYSKKEKKQTKKQRKKSILSGGKAEFLSTDFFHYFRN